MLSSWQATIGLAAGFLSLIGFIPYLITIYQRKTLPNRATWWIWTTVGFILCASYYFAGAVHTIWVPAFSAIGHLTVALLALKYGKGGWSRFDRGCLAGVGISLFLWWKFSSPFIALLINIFIDFLGALPTIRKSHCEPETEDLLTWVLFLSAHTLNLLAIQTWDFSLIAYPIYLFCITATVVLLLLRPKFNAFLRFRKQRRGSKRKLFY